MGAIKKLTPEAIHEQERRDNQERFRFVPIAEMIKKVTGANYLIKPYLKRDTVILMFGDSGSYKTFLALHMGLCVAHGKSFYGQPTHQGPVYVICGEGHSAIARRFLAWTSDIGIAQPQNLFVSEIPARLLEKGNTEEIAESIAANTAGADPALIIIDTLATNFGDGDESSNADISRLLQNVNTAIRARFKACVLIVHHVGHGDKDRERGAYAIRANVDERICVTERTKGVCVMECRKIKDGTVWPEVAFQARTVNLPGIIDSEGEQETSIVLDLLDKVPKKTNIARLGQDQQKALDCLESLYEKRRENLRKGGYPESQAIVSIEDWRAALNEAKGKKLDRQAFSKLKLRLADRGLIDVDAINVRIVELPDS